MKISLAFIRAAPVATLAIFALYCAAALGHAFEITEVDIVFHRDGSFAAKIPFHVDAMLANIPVGDLSQEDYARLRATPKDELERQMDLIIGYLRTSARFKFDGTAVEPKILFPELDKARAAGDAVPLPGQYFVLEGEVPEGASEFVFTASPIFKLMQVEIRHEGSEDVYEEMVNPGGETAVYSMLKAPAPQNRLQVASQYLLLGFEHIVPKGLDHILFVLGLFLLSAGLRPLLWQVTAFTVAHTLTLGLSTYGVVSLPTGLVEPLIALSIAYVGIENLFTSALKPWRPAVVFGFGLLHGLGFASVLQSLGMPGGRFLSALLSFNVGVEMGQLTVIAMGLLTVGWFQRKPWYRARISMPASLAISVTALYWTYERIAG